MNQRLPSMAARLRYVVMVPIGTVLAFVATLTAWQAVDRDLDAAKRALLGAGQVFASAVSRAVANHDSDGVSQGLRAIARMPGLRSAAVRDFEGLLLAELGSGVRLAQDARLSPANELGLFKILTSRSIEIEIPVIDAGRIVGNLSLISDTSGVIQQIWSGLATTLLGSSIALGVGLKLADRLRRDISGPLLALTRAASHNSSQSNFCTVPEDGRDRETVTLARTFNAMVLAIQKGRNQILARETEIIGRLARAAEYRDDDTGQHVQRVACVTRLIAEALQLDPGFVADLQRASPMHDIGKIAVRDAILRKPGKLTLDERVEMEQHALTGWDVLAGSESKLVQLAAEIAISHHERWNGEGYPKRLAGEAIPLSGRITAVADVCDALLSERPYKQAWRLSDVRAYLQKEAGLHFDPRCVEAILYRWKDVALIYGCHDIAHEAADAGTV